jgi:hypothetical protein
LEESESRQSTEPSSQVAVSTAFRFSQLTCITCGILSSALYNTLDS